MKIPPRHSAEFEQLSKLIEPMPLALLTGRDRDGVPLTSAMPAMAMDDDGALWLYADLGSRRLDPFQSMNLSFGEHASPGFVSLSGEARIESDRSLVDALWSPFAERWFPDGPDSPRLALLKFVPRTAETWDARREAMVSLFTPAATVEPRARASQARSARQAA